MDYFKVGNYCKNLYKYHDLAFDVWLRWYTQICVFIGCFNSSMMEVLIILKLVRCFVKTSIAGFCKIDTFIIKELRPESEKILECGIKRQTKQTAI